MVGCGVVFGEDARLVVGGKDEDGIDGEEGQVGGHGGGSRWCAATENLLEVVRGSSGLLFGCG